MTHSHDAESLCQVLRSGRIAFQTPWLGRVKPLIIALFAPSFNDLTIDMVAFLFGGSGPNIWDRRLVSRTEIFLRFPSFHTMRGTAPPMRGTAPPMTACKIPVVCSSICYLPLCLALVSMLTTYWHVYVLEMGVLFVKVAHRQFFKRSVTYLKSSIT